MDTNTKLTDLMADKDFVIEMMSQDSPEAVQKVFSDRGVDLSLDEIDQIGKALSEIEDNSVNGEVSEETLAEVTGGAALTTAAIVWGCVRVAGALAGLGLTVYKWYKSR